MEDRLEIWLELLAGKLDRLIELGENVERASRSQEMLEDSGEHEGDHFVGAGKMVAEEPPKKWRILEPGEVIKQGDWACPKSLPYCNDPVKGNGWIMTGAWGLPVREGDPCVFARPVADEPAKEAPKKWRILHPGESVRASDWENEDLNSETDPPDGPGWRPASMWKNGRSVLKDDKCIYARPVADGPAKQPEHPAGLKPDPGAGCLEPTEKNIGGDIEVIATASWIHGKRSPAEAPAIDKPPEPEYREPVLPADLGKWAEFSHDGINWMRYKLCGCYKESESSLTIWSEKNIGFCYCRIKKES